MAHRTARLARIMVIEKALEDRVDAKRSAEPRVAVRVLAKLAAKNMVKNQIRAQGLRLHDFAAKDISIRAEAWLEAHPEMFAQAKAKAEALGYRA